MFGWNSRSGWGRIFSSRSFQSPTARPASIAAPMAVVSMVLGRSTCTPRMSAWNCIRKSLALAPPSTRSTVDFMLESLDMALITSVDW